MRTAAVIDGQDIVNVIVLPDGADGDVVLAAMPDAVEITGMNPMPGMGNGWAYVDGVFVEPVYPDPV